MSIKRFFSFGDDKYKSEEIIKSESTEINELSTVITNSRDVLKHTIDIQTKAFKEGKKPITQSCAPELTKYFGKNNTTFRGEYNYKVWILEFAGRTFEVFTAAEYGTQVVVDLSNEDVVNGKYDDLLKSFSDKLFNIINA